MTRQYYVPQVTDLSGQELQSVFGVSEPPVCLLGGWAVQFHVNAGFEREHGREYIGSRDIDIGVHVNPDWTTEELPDKPVGRTIRRIKDLGYTKSRFGFVQHFHRDSRERISEDEASQYGMHEVFPVYVDLVPNTPQLAAFKEAFGFNPPAEQLLNSAFNNRGEPLADYVPWSPPEDVLIVPADLLAVMKIRSLPDRDKSHKRVKDVADLHALLWYVKEYSEITSEILEHVSRDELEQLESAVSQEVFEDVAGLLQVNPEPVSNSIKRLLR